MSEIDSLEVLGCLVMRWTGIIQRVFENRAALRRGCEVRRSAATRAACIDFRKAVKAGAIPVAHAIEIRTMVDGLDLSWTHPLSMRSGIRRRRGRRHEQEGR